MLSKKRTATIVWFLMLMALLMYSSSMASKGSIVILESPNGAGVTMELKEFSATDKCELSLKKDDELQIEIFRDDGEIALSVSGKNGDEPYTGNDLQSGIFTVTVSEAEEYVVGITGKDATGKIRVENLGNESK